MAPHSYGEILARNIRAARSRIDIGQENVAARMRALGFQAWIRQTVGSTERGKRRPTTEEILALALALETSMATLLQPTRDDKQVELPSGSYLGAATVVASVGGANDGSLTWKDDIPQWTGVSYAPGTYPAVSAWQSAEDEH